MKIALTGVGKGLWHRPFRLTALCSVACWILLFTVLQLSLVATAAQAAPQQQVSLDEVNAQLLAALHAYQQDASAIALQQLQSVATQRQQVLQALMASDPGTVLASALPDDLRNAMPESVRNLVEQHVRLEGELEVTIEDGRNYSRLHYGLLAAGKRLELHFADNPPTNLLTGMIVQVEGVQVGEALATSSSTTTSSTTASTSSSILPNTFGAQRTLVILVNFQDLTTQPWTVQTAQSVVFSTASNFWLENSFQQTWLTGDVAGWYTLPISSSTCNISSIQTYAQQAAQNAGYVLSNYNRFLYAFPQISACGWSGYSYIGGNPSSSWINGSLYQQVVNHELGHALGLYHSHSLGCGSAVYATSGCTQYEYGDYYETMGNSNVNGDSMHYNTFQKERLGWLNYSTQPPITSVSSSGSYTLAPYETQDGNPKALKILQSSSSSGNTYYYVESRQAIGFDSILSYSVPGYSEVLNGVVVHIASPSNANSSDLLDMNPAATWGYAMALDVGQSYTDSTAGVTITPTAVSSLGATVQVTMNGPACTLANPGVSVSPTQSQAVTAGTPVNFTVSVKDNDSSACSSSGFNLGATLPSGWGGVWSSSVLTLSPGGSASATLQVTSPSGTANGFYNVGVSATKAAASSYTASASATYVISTPQTVSISVSTNQTIYSAGQTVKVTVTVLSGSSPDAGASVTVGVTAPNGRTTTLTGTTGSTGVASLNYKLGKRAAAGTYQVQASTSAGGNSPSVVASTTFTVQ